MKTERLKTWGKNLTTGIMIATAVSCGDGKEKNTKDADLDRNKETPNFVVQDTGEVIKEIVKDPEVEKSAEKVSEYPVEVQIVADILKSHAEIKNKTRQSVDLEKILFEIKAKLLENNSLKELENCSGEECIYDFLNQHFDENGYHFQFFPFPKGFKLLFEKKNQLDLKTEELFHPKMKSFLMTTLGKSKNDLDVIFSKMDQEFKYYDNEFIAEIHDGVRYESLGYWATGSHDVYAKSYVDKTVAPELIMFDEVVAPFFEYIAKQNDFSFDDEGIKLSINNPNGTISDIDISVGQISEVAACLNLYREYSDKGMYKNILDRLFMTLNSPAASGTYKLMKTFHGGAFGKTASKRNFAEKLGAPYIKTNTDFFFSRLNNEELRDFCESFCDQLENNLAGLIVPIRKKYLKK